MRPRREAAWRRVRLCEVADVRTGLAKNSTVPPDAVRLPYIRVANVQDGRLDLTTVKQITVAREDVDRYSLRPGDVLMTEGGDFDKLGRGFVWDGQIQPCLHQNHVFAVRPDPDLLDPHFLAYFSGSPQGRAHFLRCAKRSTNLASINASQLRATPLLLPPIDEQRRIVGAIKAWDEVTRTLSALIRAKEERRMLIARQVLTGAKRFAGYTSRWREVSLGELFRERREVGFDNLQLLSVTATGGVVVRSSLERRDTSSIDKSKYRRVYAGDLVYNTMRMWQGVCGMSSFDGIVSPAYTVCAPTPLIDSRFAEYLFTLPELVHRFYQNSQGLVSDTWNLKFEHFAPIKVSIPGVDEQRHIARFVNAVEHEISTLDAERDLFGKQKRAVLQKLITGEVRLKTEERALA